MASIFVRGFNFGTEEEVLKKHFKGVGAIKEMYFQGRGAAVITYASSSSASKAVDELNNTYLEGQDRYLAVKLDEPLDPSKGEGKGKGKGKKGEGSGKGVGGAPGRTIFVTGFDFETDDDALTQHFGGKFGAIEEFHFQSKRSAVITYVKESAAKKAVSELNGSTMKGQSRYVDVKMDEPDRGGSKGGSKGASKGGKGAGRAARDSDGDNTGRAVYVSGFDYVTDSAALEKHFGTVGTIEAHYFQGKGAAVVTFTEESAAHKAVEELANTTMSGQTRYVAVKLDNPSHRKGSGKGSRA